MKRTILYIAGLLLWIELLLNVFDLWGVHHYNDLAYLAASYRTDAVRGYYLPEGYYNFRHWWWQGFEANQLPDGTRRVPDSHGWCDVAFIGDSVTWGHGVNDDQTWVNLLAQRIPQMRAINLGVDGYNSEQAKNSMVVAPRAALFVYMIVGNDPMPTEVPAKFPYTLYTYAYLRTLFTNHRAIVAPAPSDIERFERDIQSMAATGRVLFVSAEDEIMHILLADYQVLWIPDTSQDRKLRVSYVDAHANAQGARLIADSIEPALRKILPQFCGSF